MSNGKADTHAICRSDHCVEYIDRTNSPNAAQKKPTEILQREQHATVCASIANRINKLSTANYANPGRPFPCARAAWRRVRALNRPKAAAKHAGPKSCATASMRELQATSRLAHASTQHEQIGHEPVHSEVRLGMSADLPDTSVAATA